MDLKEFRDDLLNQANTRAAVDGIFTADAFMATVSELLIGAGEVDNLDLVSFTGTGRRRQSLAVNGFHHDEQDTSVSLAVLHFVGGSDVPTLSYRDATVTLRALEQYLRESLSGDFVIDREPAMPEYQLAQTLQAIYSRRGDDCVSRFRLYLLTDAQLSARAKSLDSTDIDGTPVESHIWDMQRFFQVHQSKQGREPLTLDLSDWGVDGVPALRVADSPGDVATYLAALPGDLLASLYRQHGSRLLEGNVRSFLTIRGKINRGIRETLLKDPGHFLAYNNGISATASGVEFVDGAITRITDLQIVNGGQTTASLFYATQGNRDIDLSDVFVQMKLVVVSPDEAQAMVPLISRYANSQNAVREDDFFSNSPFHVRMEELSKKLLAPAKAGVNFQTKWYYERTRGQYMNERNRRTPAEQKKFEAEFPRSQVITKTDAAKYVVTWDRQPHQVSAGAQKNFKAFASIVAERFASQPEAFNENYYRRLVAKAILFNSVRSAISKADWYESGYLANLTAYAVAKLSLEISKNSQAESFDLLRIWEAQSVGPATLNEAVNIAHLALDVLTSDDRLVVNVTEWAKKESAWKRLANLRYDLSDEFLLECIPLKLNSTGKAAVTVRACFSPDVSERKHVQDVGPTAWRSIQRFLGSQSLLNSTETRLLREVLSGSNRMLDIDVARGLLQLYVKALNHGWQEEASVRA
jgi:hypothetical protein